METNEKQIGEIQSSKRPKEGEEKLDGRPVDNVMELQLLVSEEGEEEGEEIDLPEVRFLGNPESEDDNLRPHGPDRAKVWKKTGEWVRQFAIETHPTIRERTYDNRLEAEKSYFHGEEEPDYYEWQEDEETLAEIRPRYRQIKQGLINQIGRPTRSDFGSLYPHKYDDPGLSERGRRSVRDLKAVFGQDVVVSS
ncbi:hypothetical protein K9M78_01580 [Candidatus Bipolaricaulota bacterium]|nr:hypothetical protein [Candidatus Bipolaricaulota bacterium]